MMELLQSFTILMLAASVIFNFLIARRLIKAVSIIQKMLVLVMVTR